MKNLFFKILAVLLGLILFVLGLEGVMRAIAWSITEKQQLSYAAPDFSNKKEIRIAVLGESTSAEYFADSADTSWPKVLEQKLSARYSGITFKVYNLAVPSINTTQLLEKYFTVFEEIKPQITIAMMGINDTSAIEPLTTYKIPSLKVFKLLNWIISSFKAKSSSGLCQKVTFPNSLNFELDQKITTSDFSFDDSNIEPASRFSYYSLLGQKLFGFSDKQSLSCDNSCTEKKQILYKLADNYLQKAIALCPTEPEVLRASYFISNRLGQNAVARKNFETAVKLGYVPDSGTLAYILTFADLNDKNDFVMSYARENSLTISNKSALAVTKNNFSRLIEFAQKNDSKLILMPYPTASLNALKYVLTESPNQNFEIFANTIYNNSPTKTSDILKSIYFVSNENFNDKLRQISYQSLFTDNFCSVFACRFGHTTTLGHKLIAENIVEQTQTLFADLLN